MGMGAFTAVAASVLLAGKVAGMDIILGMEGADQCHLRRIRRLAPRVRARCTAVVEAAVVVAAVSLPHSSAYLFPSLSSPSFSAVLDQHGLMRERPRQLRIPTPSLPLGTQSL